MNNFANFGLPSALAANLANMGYNEPTPIQEKAIPLALEGKDILGSAQTGTGKTAAFAIPLVAKLIADPQAKALVLTPTRELAMQVMEIVRKLMGELNRRDVALIIGGANMQFQIRDLRNNPRIIIGTPGRINDHLRRKTLKLDRASFLVLDETDRMLDMGFSIQLDEIFKFLPEQRQTLMFSATMPKNIVKLAQKYLKNPERVQVGSTTLAAPKIKQDIKYLAEEEKFKELLAQLHERKGSVIIFAKTKRGVDKLAVKLNNGKHTADAIHGDLKQNKRKRVIDDFRKEKFRIMVATDVAARGLDIPHIEHVINYDLPQCPEDYIHRIGRTGRAGAEGNALCLITPADRRIWKEIARMMNPDAKNDYEQKPEFQNRPNRGDNNSGGKKFVHKQNSGNRFKGKRSFSDRRPQSGNDAHEFEGGNAEGRKFSHKKDFGSNFKGKRSFSDRRPQPANDAYEFEGGNAEGRKFSGKPAGKFGPRFGAKSGGKPEGKFGGKPGGKFGGKKKFGGKTGGFKGKRSNSEGFAGKFRPERKTG